MREGGGDVAAAPARMRPSVGLAHAHGDRGAEGLDVCPPLPSLALALTPVLAVVERG